MWRPIPAQVEPDRYLRVPTPGTLRNLESVHESFLASVDGNRYIPPLTPNVFGRVGYVPPDHVEARPSRIFELRHDDGSFCAYSQRRLIHIAGMVRHLAKEAMAESPPRGVGDDWIERYVLGHRDKNTSGHRQFSYVPLPSIGHRHADHLVRRVMLIAPVGGDRLLEHLARRLSGRQLRPLPKTNFGPKGPPSLTRVQHDKMAEHYTRPASVWHSVTPVILPGHDDHKPAKRRKLIERAWQRSSQPQSRPVRPAGRGQR